MKVSVIIPTRDRHALLKEAIHSVAVQTYSNVELIVVDDGSIEPVEAVALDSWKSLRPSEMIKVIRQPGSNGNVARNSGINASSGDFIQFLDSDDLISQGKIEHQIRQLDSAPNLDFVYSHERFFTDSPGDLSVIWNCDWYDSPFESIDRFLAGEPVWQTGGPLWRRRAFADGFRWNEDLSSWQDWEFHTRALLKRLQGARTPGDLYHIRQHLGLRTFTSESKYKRKRNEVVAGAAILRELEDNKETPDRQYHHFECYLRKRLDELAGDYSADAVELRQKFLSLLSATSRSPKITTFFRMLARFASSRFFDRLFSIYKAKVPMPLCHMSTWMRISYPLA